MDDIADRFCAVAARWDLAGLQQEVAAAMADLDAPLRPYVPSQLVRALDMFLDSYGDSAASG